jgi:hypothetical protein
MLELKEITLVEEELDGDLDEDLEEDEMGDGEFSEDEGDDLDEFDQEDDY